MQDIGAWLDTRGNERRAFRGLLTGSLVSLARHAVPLCRAVQSRVATRLAVLLSSRHRGRKQRPKWLGRDPLPRALQFHADALPPYTCTVRASVHAAGASAGDPAQSRDPEDYLADHRWGFLLDAILLGAPDLRHCLDRCARWVASHADRADRAWEPYSTSERVANLLVFLAAMPAAHGAFRLPLDTSRWLGESADWIHRHLEYYGPFATNNHILNNARALTMAGSAGREPGVAAAGMCIFRACLPQLIMPGGFLRERSSHYQLVILNWVLDAWWFLAAAAGADSADARFLQAYIERMLDAAAMVCDRGKSLLATIGDVSPDSSPAQSLARLSLLYPDRWPVRTRSAESPESRDGWFRIAAGSELVLGNFPAGGYPPRFPTHGHCDHPGFVWLHDGREVLTDPGRFRYTHDPVSTFQRGAAAHNVPLVNGLAPLCESLTEGVWWPRPYADATLDAGVTGGGVVLTHDGFARATPVRRHARRIVPQHAALTIVDSFDGEGEADLTFCWHFGEGFTAFDPERLAVTGSAGRLTLSIDGVHGQPTPHAAASQTWISRVYGQKLPALGVFLRWRVRLPLTVSTRFSLSPPVR